MQQHTANNINVNANTSLQLPQQNQYIYVLGYIETAFPSLSVENEFQQCLQLEQHASIQWLAPVSDQISCNQLNHNPALNSDLYKVLSQPQNIHLARNLNWSLSNSDKQNIYTLTPSSPEQLKQFIAAIAPQTTNTQQQNSNNQDPSKVILIGRANHNNSPTPNVTVSNIIPVSSSALQSKITHSQSITNNQYLVEMIEEILSLTANDGYNDGERALNYSLYNNMQLYANSYNFYYNSNSQGPNASGYQIVDVQIQTAYSGERIISKVIFHYQGINTGAIQSWYCSVDVTGEFPFFVHQWRRYLPRG